MGTTTHAHAARFVVVSLPLVEEARAAAAQNARERSANQSNGKSD